MTAPHSRAHRVLRSWPVRIGLALLLLTGLVAWIAHVEVGRDLAALEVSVLSGSPEGNYHRIVDAFAAVAAEHHGRLTNLESQGTVDNLARLGAAKARCEVAFALVQDGQSWPTSPRLELIAQLPRPESVLVLGKNADALHEFSELRGKRIGIGPEGSGTARVARQLFATPDFASLGIVLEPHPLAEQLDLAERGQLDLAVFVIDEDAAIIRTAVRERGLQIASFTHADAALGEGSHLHLGRIGAGHYDPVRLLPAQDRSVLQVDALLVGNGCAGRSRTLGFLSVASTVFPDLVRYNREHPNTTGLELSSASHSFFENGGPEPFDLYAPWLADVMPAGKWLYVVTAISVLFNAMGFGHRFQLWRIDVNRVRMENEMTALFGPTTTLGDIRALQPNAQQRTPEILAACRRIIGELEELAARSRRMSLSPLVPMGQEMGYRYQESLIHETLAVLREFVRRAAG